MIRYLDVSESVGTAIAQRHFAIDVGTLHTRQPPGWVYAFVFGLIVLGIYYLLTPADACKSRGDGTHGVIFQTTVHKTGFHNPFLKLLLIGISSLTIQPYRNTVHRIGDSGLDLCVGRNKHGSGIIL